MVRKTAVLLCVLALLTGCAATKTAETIPADIFPDTKVLPEAAPASAGDGSDISSALHCGSFPEQDDTVLVPDQTQLEEWQKAYIMFLRDGEVRRADYPDEFFEEWYAICDMDKDGVPELFLKYGNCEANYMCRVLTYQEGRLIEVGELDFWHSSLYTWPGENAVLQCYGHSYKGFRLVDGSLVRIAVNWEALWDASSVYDIPPPEVVVPGAQWLALHSAMVKLPQREPLILPVLDYTADSPTLLTPDETAAAEQAIQAALTGDEPIYHIPGDNYTQGMGWTTFADYCGPGSDPYQLRTSPLEIADILWSDLNGDGARECVLSLCSQRKGGGQGRQLMVFSAQNGVVYAMDFFTWGWPDENGVFWPEDGYYFPFRISFRQDQCYKIYVQGAL